MDKKYEIWIAEADLKEFELFKEIILTNSHDFKLLHFASGVRLFESLIERKKKFDQAMPNLIVLDQMLPEKSGWEILESIKSDPELQHIVVIMMSDRYTQDNIDNGFRMGMDGYIRKPVFVGEWKSLIEKLMLTWKDGGS